MSFSVVRQSHFPTPQLFFPTELEVDHVVPQYALSIFLRTQQQISDLYEQHKAEKDPEKKKALYKKIGEKKPSRSWVKPHRGRFFKKLIDEHRGIIP